MFRLTILVVVAALLAGGLYAAWERFNDARAASSEPAIFSGYVDVTATPTYAFETPVSDAGKSVVLSFIVSSSADPCEPSWGNAYSLAQAGQDLDLDRRVARLVQQAGNISVSFGGQANQELATNCTDPAKLKDAYASVVERYNLSSIDLDVEGAGLTDTAAAARRATAIAALQADRQSAGKPLSVWLTLPVAPTGLTSDGTAAVAAMLDAKVDLAGVNVMTMDFGASKPAGTSMADASIQAAQATRGQVSGLYRSHGENLGTDLLWRKIGITPMIGQNDLANEVFTLDDAATVQAFAIKEGVGRVSMWSLNRDASCGPNYPDVTRVSDGCSGINQNGRLFSQVLGHGMDTMPAKTPQAAAPVATAMATQTADNPATSPYPIWNEVATYVADDRIVWHGNVYEAKWWNQDELPDNPVAADGTTPWRLVGPVLPGDHPSAQATVPAGSFPEWKEATIYQKGDLAMFGGYVFAAKWWTRDDSPEAALQGATDSPWNRLKDPEVTTLLQDKKGK